MNTNDGKRSDDRSSKDAHVESSGNPAVDETYKTVVMTDEVWSTCPENPWVWPAIKKWTVMSSVGFFGFLAPLASSMLAPSLPSIAEKFHVTNPTLVNLPLSIYLLAYATGPLIISPLSEIHGRLWIMQISNVVLFVFNLGCAFAPNEVSLIIFRFLSGLGGSTFSSMSGSIVSDIFPPQDRAAAMSFYIMGPLLGPVLGPLIGGFVAQHLGYKWVFIITSIVSGLAGVYAICLPLKESYHPVLRERLIRRSQESAGGLEREKVAPPSENRSSEDPSEEEKKVRTPADGDIESGSILCRIRYEYPPDYKPPGTTNEILAVNMTRPFALFFRSLILFILGLFMSVQYGIFYIMFATFSALFPSIYGFSTGITGLCYLGLGLGFFILSIFGATVSNKIYHKLSSRNNNQGVPEYRMPTMLVGTILVPTGLFWFGWSAQARLHWIMPIIGSSIFSGGMILTYLSIQLYIVDSFKFAASALSSVAVFRAIFGFAFPLFATQMFDALGTGPGYSIFGGVLLLIGIPFPIWIFYYGAAMRARSPVNR